MITGHPEQFGWPEKFCKKVINNCMASIFGANFEILSSKLKIDITKVDDDIYNYLLNYREELVNAVLDFILCRYNSGYYPTPNDIAKRVVALHALVNKVTFNEENRKKYYELYSIKKGYTKRK